MMKRFLLLLLMAALFGGKVSAQKGMNGIGVTVPIGYIFEHQEPNNKSKNYAGGLFAGVGVKYYLNLTNNFRMELAGEFSPITPSYFFKGMLNLNFFFSTPRPARPYFIIGGGVMNESFKLKKTINKFDEKEGRHTVGYGMNSGLGLDCRLSHHWSMQVEATAVGVIVPTNNRSMAFVSRLGLIYNF